MNCHQNIIPKNYELLSHKNINKIGQLNNISSDFIAKIKAVSMVLPFRVNNYVIEELIDWDDIPHDPIFQLTFPQPEMLDGLDLDRMHRLLNRGAPKENIASAALEIQMNLNPHPAGQMDLNVPAENENILNGMQHKYPETVLFFPSQGQTCHAFCTYCFRWAQFVGLDKLKFASNDINVLVRYLREHIEVTDVLFTGGDPLTMGTTTLRHYIEPLLAEKPGNLATIRIGTKVPAYWPYRFVTDKDADELIRLFEKIVESGFQLAIMFHCTHPRELDTPIAKAALKRIQNTGAIIRCQSPIIKHVNDDAEIWAEMWKKQVTLGAIPYYMFIGRDTGPKDYFKIPLVKAHQIFSEAYRKVSGLCRTVRGPSMSATPGKVLIDGIAEINNKKHFCLKFIQGRNPEWVNRIFFARYDEKATWLDELEPSFGEKKFFFDKTIKKMKAEKKVLKLKKKYSLREDIHTKCA
ncbi:MAG: lysine 2,3-aminomutase [Desulfobacterales bacterium]|nr:lysine 2,3-aminomutase [Desulfobacterales bacterium]